MTKLMKLACSISNSTETPGMFRVVSEMYDGTPFSLKVTVRDVVLNDPITEDCQTVDGWLFVDHVGEQAGRVAVILPAPSLEHGKNISVSSLKLMPRQASIDMFHPGLKTPAE